MRLNWNDDYNKKLDFTCHWLASSLLLIQYQKLPFCLGLFSGCSRLSVMVTSYLIPVTRDCHFIWQKGLCSCEYVKGLEKRLPWNLWSGPGVIPGVLVTGRQEEFKSEKTVEADLWSEAGRGREPEAEKARKWILPWNLQKERCPLDTLILNFWPSQLWDNHLLRQQ